MLHTKRVYEVYSEGNIVLTVQIKTFFVIAQKNTDLPIHTRMLATQDRLTDQINKFISSQLDDPKYEVGDIRIWSGADPLSLHGMVVYQIK